MAFLSVVKPASCLQCFGFLSSGAKHRANVDASSKNVQTHRPYDVEELRTQAKKTLQDAVASGRLSETLAEIRPTAEQCDENVERQLKDGVPTRKDGVQSRDLSALLSTYTAYTQKKNAHGKHTTTEKCKDLARKMERSTEVISKEAMTQQLQEVNKLMTEFLAAIGPTEATMQQIREEEALLGDFSHDPEAGEIKSSVPAVRLSPSELREKAKRALLTGVSSGRLELALAETLASENADTKQPRSEPTTQDLRTMIKQSFLNGMTSGRANSISAKLNPEQGEQDSGSLQESQLVDTEVAQLLRQQVKHTLSDGCDSGRLQSALSKVRSDRLNRAPNPSKGGS